MDTLLRFVVWLFAFSVANWAYHDFVRSGERGFKRLVAFWIGWPLSLITKLAVSEAPALGMREDDEGLRELVAHIRRDRRLRVGDGQTGPHGNTTGLAGTTDAGTGPDAAP